MNKYILPLIFLIVILSSCKKREWNNLFDPNCPKEIWTPTDFKAVQVGAFVKLTWQQPIKQISGFKIQKTIENGSSTTISINSQYINQLDDISLAGGLNHTYSLSAIAGNNSSNSVTVQIIPILTALITTTSSTSFTSNSITTGGTITTDGGAPITARGVCWSTNQNPTITDSKTANGTGTGSFISIISGLTAGTTYYYRAYATNSSGTTYGVPFYATTLATIPILSSTSVSVATFSTAMGGSVIISDGGAPIITKGVCWSKLHNPTIADSKSINTTSTVSYIDSIKGLSNNVTYYMRAYATNQTGTAYGNENSVILYLNVPDAAVTDIDGNVYKTVKIGNQVWMAENLKVSKYRNGVAIPNVTDGSIWNNLTSGAYCDFANSPANGITYGHLYNYFAVVDSRQLSPIGYHIPSAAEWRTVLDYLGGGKIAGSALKETGTLHWKSPNTSTNSSGFTALAGSWRGGDGIFYYAPTLVGYCWSSTSYNSTYSNFFNIELDNNTGIVLADPYFTKQAGCNIRCVKD